MTNPNKTLFLVTGPNLLGCLRGLEGYIAHNLRISKTLTTALLILSSAVQCFNIYIETLFYTKITQRIFKHLFNDTNSRLDSNFNTLWKNWRKTYVICQWHCCDGSPWSLPRLDKSKQSPHSFVQQLLHFSFFHSLEYAKATRWLFSNVFVQLFSQTD